MIGSSRIPSIRSNAIRTAACPIDFALIWTLVKPGERFAIVSILSKLATTISSPIWIFFVSMPDRHRLPLDRSRQEWQ